MTRVKQFINYYESQFQRATLLSRNSIQWFK